VKYRIGSLGCALVGGALGAFECAQHGRYQCGDHLILVGRILRFEATQAGEPLAFCQGSYGTFTRDQSGVMAPPDSSLSDFVSYWG
jgi:flavin reductase (DIM6/NTAB) family NADH-FMN oxidoreductase RutF